MFLRLVLWAIFSLSLSAANAQPPNRFGPPIPELILAIDADRNDRLSREEIAAAADALNELDRNSDGKLTSDESGWPPSFFGGVVPFPPPPVIAAIDVNGDQVISAEEIENIVGALEKLDKNNDGQIAGSEMLPEFGNGPGGGRPRDGRPESAEPSGDDQPGGGQAIGGPGPPRQGPGGPGRGGPGFGGQGRGGPGFGGQGRGGPGRGGPGMFGGGASGKQLSPEELKFEDGVATIPDHATFHRLSYRGEEVMIDTFLADLEFVKFTLNDAQGDDPQLYFINTKTHRAHMMFANVAGLGFGRGNDQMKGVLVYRPMLESPGGNPGLYTFEFEPFDTYSFEMVKIAYDTLIAKMPVLKGNLGYYPRERGKSAYEQDKALYEKAGLPVYLDEDLIDTRIAYLPLNQGKSFGLLRLMSQEDRPGPRDVVIYRSLPNELSRVAGVMTEVRQTPLSHVNLRAVQDGIPNAFLAGASQKDQIRELIGKPVCYEVTPDGFEIREASVDEVDAYFADLRPTSPQIPARDLSVKKIRKLDELAFQDLKSVGVKAANVAALRTIGLGDGVVPAGHAVPFYFYDEFMKFNGFYKYLTELLQNPEFQRSRETQVTELKRVRHLIEQGKMPRWMMQALSDLQKTYPANTSLRCRSSTNNEDLPGFSGAGLYDSFTHKPDEGHLSKSIQQVFASMWNFRAFEEREFYRVDHFDAAMGVLIHPNFKGEIANGVAVTDDILYQTYGNYYVNTQVGEDLVTNPEAESVPEEVLLGWRSQDGHQVMRSSNQIGTGKELLSEDHLSELRNALTKIHAKFAVLYGHSLNDEDFAMEIEFKITKGNQLAIKQARPWVFATRRQPGTQEE